MFACKYVNNNMKKYFLYEHQQEKTKSWWGNLKIIMLKPHSLKLKNQALIKTDLNLFLKNEQIKDVIEFDAMKKWKKYDVRQWWLCASTYAAVVLGFKVSWQPCKGQGLIDSLTS